MYNQLMHRHWHASLLILFGLAWLSPAASADVRLPEILDDHMVLQQNAEVEIWGWAWQGETVVIEASWGAKAQAVGDANGKWKVTLKTPAARSLAKGLHPETISITAPNENAVHLQDLLIGEVWVCSGQSNMAMTCGPDSPPGSNNWFGDAFWGEESKHADRPGLRLFNVEKTASLTPRDDCKGVIPDHIRFVPDAQGHTPVVKRGWQPCTAETAGYFSAVAYYFGAAVQEKLNVPVGLVTCPVGGTSIEPWIRLEALRQVAGHENATPIAHRNGDAALFNGMIAPLTPMKIRGVVWYQGESSVGLGSRYGALQNALIHDWRNQFFDAADMPFYIVQLTGFGHDHAGRAAELREAQATVLQLKNTGMAVTNDVGEPDNIHPKNKRDIGRRLALQALQKTYDRHDIAADGPVFESITEAHGKLRIAFRNTGGNLVSRDGKPLTCFEVAGADGKFVPAAAEIEGNVVIVSSPDIPQPKAARFGWGDGDVPNLTADNGLPAAQFRVTAK